MNIFFDLIKKIFKYSFFLTILLFVMSFFGEYIKAFVYHINLATYILNQNYLNNDTIFMMIIGIIALVIHELFLFIKKLI